MRLTQGRINGGGQSGHAPPSKRVTFFLVITDFGRFSSHTLRSFYDFPQVGHPNVWPRSAFVLTELSFNFDCIYCGTVLQSNGLELK